MMPILAAAAATGSSNPLVDYGLFGILFALFFGLWLGGKIVSGREYDRVLEINNRVSADNAVLRERLIDTAESRVANARTLQETAAVLRDVLVALEVRKQSSS